ncbi:hypothetical protein DTO013E5_3882 [Penicillium roqueforti]|nr:hypothetical protein DTO012A1_694 [Penicillium roqueforti]KAI2755096.1 hypothetical protein DTO013F2_1588 [Penicillium roqueforti]KAI3213241.1 hypothetical protein DTO013E5_3882 [Penicillium roqueforti]
MDLPGSGDEGTSHESTGIDPTGIDPTGIELTLDDIPDSPLPPTNYEDPSYYTGYLDFVPSPPRDDANPYLDPSIDMDDPMAPFFDPYLNDYQPYRPVEYGVDRFERPPAYDGLFEDPNVLPSHYTYPQRTPDNSCTTDPMGILSTEQYERVLADEQELLNLDAGGDPRWKKDKNEIYQDILDNEHLQQERIQEELEKLNNQDTDSLFADLKSATVNLDFDFLHTTDRATSDRDRAAIDRDLPGSAIDRELADMAREQAARDRNMARERATMDRNMARERATMDRNMARERDAMEAMAAWDANERELAGMARDLPGATIDHEPADIARERAALDRIMADMDLSLAEMARDLPEATRQRAAMAPDLPAVDLTLADMDRVLAGMDRQRAATARDMADMTRDHLPEITRQRAAMALNPPFMTRERAAMEAMSAWDANERELADMDRERAAMDLKWAAMDRELADKARDLPGPSQADTPKSEKRAKSAEETLPSVEEASPTSNRPAKRARRRATKKKSSTPVPSTSVSARTSASVQQPSASPKTTAEIDTETPQPASIKTRHASLKATVKPEIEMPPPASTATRRTSIRNKTESGPSTSASTSRRPANKSKLSYASGSSNPHSSTNSQTETAVPGPPQPSGAQQPASKRRRRGNKSPASWEEASKGDKMMSQMKQGNPAVRWSEVAEAWNANRFEWEDEMTWRAVTRRWGRIMDKLGPWPGFDAAILEALQQFGSQLLNDGHFVLIAQHVSEQIGWKVLSTACRYRYQDLKEAGKVDVKGKGRARE